MLTPTFIIEPNFKRAPGNFTPGFAAEIKKCLDRHGIRISVLGCYINPVDPVNRKNELELFKEHLRFAKYSGAGMVGTETGSAGSTAETHTEKTYQLLLEGMKDVVSYAEKLGVMIGIEPVSSFTIHSPEITKRFLSDIDSPNVSIIFDPVNMISEENYKEQKQLIDSSFELFGDRIAVVHLKDFAIENGVKVSKPVGSGMLDYEYLFEKIIKNKPYIDMILDEMPFSLLEDTRSFLIEMQKKINVDFTL